MNEAAHDSTVEGLLLGHLGNILHIVGASGDDATWMRRLSTSVLTFEHLVEGLTGREAVTPFDLDEDDPDADIGSCLEALRVATEVAADTGLIPSRRLFVEDITPILDAIAEERGIE